MRSFLLLASALAIGALAGPIEKRHLVTEVDLTIVTVTIFVTLGQHAPTPAAIPKHAKSSRVRSRRPGPPSHKASSSKATSTASSARSSVFVTKTPAIARPTTKVTTTRVSTSSAFTPRLPTTTVTRTTVTTTKAPASTAPSSRIPASKVPASKVSSTTVPISTTTSGAVVFSSQVPAASSAVAFGAQHVSGEIQATLSFGADYQNAILWHHNRARANHGAGNLEWSAECEAGARTAAKFCDFSHSHLKGLKQGQNLWAISGDNFAVTQGITESWYQSEADLYSSWWGQEPPHNATDPSMLDFEQFEKYGHMTQMVWKATTHVGCVSIDCGERMTGVGDNSINKYTVCNYSPPGNYVNAFAQNVVAPIASYSGYSATD